MTALTRADRINIQRDLSSRSFADFLRMAWPHIDPEDYVHNWHMDCVGEHLEAIARGEIRRLLFNVPPGTSKSSAVSVFFPAWLWGPAGLPQFRFIGAAHEQTLATRDNLRTRRLISSEWYQERWPTTIMGDQNEKTYFENDKFGFRQSAAVKSMTGKRGHIVAWDDPISVEHANSETQRNTANRVFAETLQDRLVDKKKSAIVIMMQRVHVNDVSGKILAEDLGYEHVMLPMEFEPERRCYTALKPRHMASEPVTGRYHGPTQRWAIDGDDSAPKDLLEAVEGQERRTVYNQDKRTKDGEPLFEGRFPRSVIEADKKAMGSYAFAGQHQQRPVPRGGGMFNRTWFNPVNAAPAGTEWMRGWDLAATKKRTGNNPAFTAGVLIGRKPDGGFVVGHACRIQGTPGEAETLILHTAALDGKDVLGSLPQDPGQAGKSQAQYLIKQLAGYAYTATPESGEKEVRALPFAAQAEAGNVDIVVGPWNKAYLDELEQFPFGTFADQTDASSRAFNELAARPVHKTANVRFKL